MAVRTGLMSQKISSIVVQTKNLIIVEKNIQVIESHPAEKDGVNQMLIHYLCFHSSGDYRTTLVRNCAGFFVYKFLCLPLWDYDFDICTEHMSHGSFLT